MRYINGGPPDHLRVLSALDRRLRGRVPWLFRYATFDALDRRPSDPQLWAIHDADQDAAGFRISVGPIR